MDNIFKKPESVFIRAKAREILFDGLPVDCTGKDFASSAICSVLKEKDDALIADGPGRYLFSLFGPVRIFILRFDNKFNRSLFVYNF